MTVGDFYKADVQGYVTIRENLHQMPSSYPQLTLYPKISSAVLLLLTSSSLAIAGLVVAKSNPWLGIACVGLFGLCALVALIKLIPRSTYLKLDETGLTYCNMFRKSTMPWSSVDQ